MAVAAVAVTHPPITMVLRFTTHAFRKFLVTGTVLVSLAAPALAIDAYDGATGQLTIPVVRAYGNLYRDVVVEIGEVVSVKGGAVLDPVDRYDADTNQLFIPAVRAMGQTYTNVRVTVKNVLKVGSASGGAPVQLDQLPSSTVATVNLNTASGYLGSDVLFYNLLGKGDLNGDGYEDLVIGLFRHTTNPSYSGRDYDPSGEIRPIVLFYNPSTDGYEVNAQLQSVIRKNQHPRQVAIADFDGDGRNDLFIADHGYDDAPYGNPNTLLLNKPGGYVDGTDRLPKYTDFSHGLVMADFDGNGRPDLLVMNNRVDDRTKCQLYPAFKECSDNPPKHSESYVLFNQGTQGLVPGVLPIPNEVINFTATNFDKNLRLYVGHSADFNQDGRADLVVSNHRNLFVLESAAAGRFAPAQVFSPPAQAQAACKDYIPYTAITSLDMDADGVPEILASFGCGLQAVEFQVFKRAANGVWSDATARFVGDQQANTTLADGWCYKLEVEDLNNDGIPDVICQSTRGLGTPTNNVFWWGGPTLRASGITLQNGDWTNFQTVVKNRDGLYLLGLRNRKGESLLSVQRWKIR